MTRNSHVKECIYFPLANFISLFYTVPIFRICFFLSSVICCYFFNYQFNYFFILKKNNQRVSFFLVFQLICFLFRKKMSRICIFFAGNSICTKHSTNFLQVQLRHLLIQFNRVNFSFQFPQKNTKYYVILNNLIIKHEYFARRCKVNRQNKCMTVIKTQTH